MGGMDLHTVETRLLGTVGRDGESGDGGLDLGGGHGGRTAEATAVLTSSRPTSDGPHTTPGMSEAT